jgi:hypothetical protein
VFLRCITRPVHGLPPRSRDSLPQRTQQDLWNWGPKRVPASQAGIFVDLEPLVGAILGVSLLHGALGIMALAEGALIIGAAVYFTTSPKVAVRRLCFPDGLHIPISSLSQLVGCSETVHAQRNQVLLCVGSRMARNFLWYLKFDIAPQH